MPTRPSVVIVCPKEFKFTDPEASVERPHLADVADLTTVMLDFGAPLPAAALDAHAHILWHGPRMDAAVIAQLKNCRVIIRNGVGFDTVDTAAAAKAGIPVCNVPDYGDATVAEHAFALLLASVRHIVRAAERTRLGDFSQSGLRGV
ncbi:MAG: hypothetical protein ABL955_16695, partial [Elusimicrobiota bacterium]